MAALSVQYFAGGTRMSKSSTLRQYRQRRADRGIGGNAARDNQRGTRRPRKVLAETLQRVRRTVFQNIDRGGLERGAGIIDIHGGLRFELAHGRLQTGKGEVHAGASQQGPRQRIGLGIAARGVNFHIRAAGIGQAQNLRGLVEGLAHRVVHGGAVKPIILDTGGGQQLAMTARNQKQQEGKIHPLGQARGQTHARPDD